MGDNKNPKEEPKVKIPPAPPKPQNMLIVQESADSNSAITKEIIKQLKQLEKSKDK